MRRVTGFTLVELLVVIGLVGLLVGLLVPVLHNAQKSVRSSKDANQQRQIHQGFLSFAGAHEGLLPLPGLINRQPVQIGGQPYEMPNEGEEDPAHNWTGPLYSAMVAQDFFATDILVGPTEVNPVVVPDADYDHSQYDPSNDTYWDPSFQAKISATTGQGMECNVSYAHEGLCGNRKGQRWRDTQDTTFPILSTRGVKGGVVTGDDYTKSPTLELHGSGREWIGNIVFADNHWEQTNSFFPAQTTYKAAAGDPAQDNIFAAEFGAGLADPRADADAWMVISTSAADDGLTVEAEYDAY